MCSRRAVRSLAQPIDAPHVPAADGALIVALPTNLSPIRGAEALPDQICSVLRRAIIEGQFEPGGRIQPEEIAAHFAISKIPVREALRTLEAGGWIRIRPRRGVYVQEHSSDELRNLCETHLFLMPRMARLAAERRTHDQLQRIRESLVRWKAAMGQATAIEWAERSGAFHEACVQAAANDCCARIVGDIELRLRWYNSRVPLARLRRDLRPCQRILGAIADADGPAAEAAMLSHIGAAHEAALSSLQSLAA